MVFLIIVFVICLSVVCILINIELVKKMGVFDIFVKIIMFLGVNIYKDGFVIGGIYKIMFLFVIFGREMNSLSLLLIILFSGLLIGVVVGVILGGGVIGEMLILSIFGFL